MKPRIVLVIIFSITLIITGSVIFYQLNHNSLESALEETNVEYDEIYHTTEYKDHSFVFLGDVNSHILTVGMLDVSDRHGYRWVKGFGSELFQVNDQVVTRAFSNFQPRHFTSDEDLITIVFGVIAEDSIEKLNIIFNDAKPIEAEIIETSKGRIWYQFSDTPLSGDPDVIRIYKDGTERTGWYDE